MNESKTPRTDAEEFNWHDDCTPENGTVVAASFARQLETELHNAEAITGNALRRVTELETELAAMDEARQLAHDNTSKVTHALSKLMEAIPKMEAELAASKAREDDLAAALEFINDECDWEPGGDYWNLAGDKRIGPACDKALEAWRAAK